MTTITADPALKPCECGCGELVKGKFKRGHYLRDQANRLTRLPGPDDDLDAADDGPPEPDASRQNPPGLSQADRDALADSMRDQAADAEIPPDRPAGRLRERAARTSPPKARAKVRVTASVRQDVHAKIRFALVPAGQVWQARDPLCGGAFAEQEPEVSDALADIVCDSPDLLAWFTGPAGGFMKYFKLIMALQPVALTIWAHHIAHAIELAEDGQQPQQMPAYAA